MPKVLTENAIDQYHREGYFFPIRILDDEGVAANRCRLEDFEANQGKPVEGAQRSKSHLLFKWVDDLMRDSKLLDAVED
ncbi:MAG: phytanoyl-CoA dioxygenase, partial [Candidatus Poribacteria bacterium]|nr:phytanoyl-CoA dioxygenase [Candidatus Poribacteria bacterium]